MSLHLQALCCVCNQLENFMLYFLRFDINGPGSCLKRYSDPTYFRRASGNLIQGNKKFQNKNCKIKVWFSQIILVNFFSFSLLESYIYCFVT